MLLEGTKINPNWLKHKKQIIGLCIRNIQGTSCFKHCLVHRGKPSLFWFFMSLFHFLEQANICRSVSHIPFALTPGDKSMSLSQKFQLNHHCTITTFPESYINTSGQGASDCTLQAWLLSGRKPNMGLEGRSLSLETNFGFCCQRVAYGYTQLTPAHYSSFKPGQHFWTPDTGALYTWNLNTIVIAISLWQYFLPMYPKLI